MKINWFPVILLLAFVPAGCTPYRSAAAGKSTTRPLDTQLQELPVQTTLSNPADGIPPITVPLEFADTPSVENNVNKLIELAKQDLADRLKIDVIGITLLKTMEITWPDVSQGCSPGSGQILAKGRVYGYGVWLEAGGQNYIYHAALTGQLFPCPKLEPGVNNPLLMTPGGPTPNYQDQGP